MNKIPHERRPSDSASKITISTSVEVDEYVAQTRTSSLTYYDSTVISELVPLNTCYSKYLLEHAQSSNPTPLPKEAEIRAILDVRKAEVGVIAMALVETFLELKLMVVSWDELQDRDEVKNLVPRTVQQQACDLSGVKGGFGMVLFDRDIVEVLFRREDCEVLFKKGRILVRTMGLPMFASGYFEC
jgi:hypothetical protein